MQCSKLDFEFGVAATMTPTRLQVQVPKRLRRPKKRRVKIMECSVSNTERWGKKSERSVFKTELRHRSREEPRRRQYFAPSGLDDFSRAIQGRRPW
jgi:hypothetical protein